MRFKQLVVNDQARMRRSSPTERVALFNPDGSPFELSSLVSSGGNLILESYDQMFLTDDSVAVPADGELHVLPLLKALMPDWFVSDDNGTITEPGIYVLGAYIQCAGLPDDPGKKINYATSFNVVGSLDYDTERAGFEATNRPFTIYDVQSLGEDDVPYTECHISITIDADTSAEVVVRPFMARLARVADSSGEFGAAGSRLKATAVAQTGLAEDANPNICWDLYPLTDEAVYSLTESEAEAGLDTITFLQSGVYSITAIVSMGREDEDVLTGIQGVLRRSTGESYGPYLSPASAGLADSAGDVPISYTEVFEADESIVFSAYAEGGSWHLNPSTLTIVKLA